MAVEESGNNLTTAGKLSQLSNAGECFPFPYTTKGTL